MKIKKFNESVRIPSNDEEMRSFIADNISCWIDMRQVRYGEPDEMEINPDSVDLAASEILKELKRIGIDFDLFYNAKKYNL